MKYYFIYNPIAGNSKSKNVVVFIQEFCQKNKLSYEIIETIKVAHATDIVRDLTINNNEIKTIISVGGDGTLNEVINGIKNFSKTIIGVIPNGSGNDFASSMNILQDQWEVALNIIVGGKTKKIDFININNNFRSINMLGFGLESRILEAYNKLSMFSPSIRYKIATFKKVFWLKNNLYQIKLDGSKKIEINGPLISIGNGTRCGGGIKTCPNAKVDDGLLTVTCIKKTNPLKKYFVLLKVLNGKILNIKQTESYNCRKIEIITFEKIYEADGLIFQNTGIIKASIDNEKINFLVK